MILNSYAILLGFVALLRLVLGLVVLGVGVSAWRVRDRFALEDRSYLVFLLALLLGGLNLASWPLLYLLLQSYVPEWTGVMCIYGVTQIGANSIGPSRFLPGLLHFLQLAKPALVFLSGAWLVLYLLNRRTQTAPLLPRLFWVLLPLGALVLADAAAELAYLAIPKKEETLSNGCCCATEEAEGMARYQPPVLLQDASRPWLVAGFYGANLGLIFALLAATRSPAACPGSRGLALLFLGALAVTAISGLYLVAVAAPGLLHLPYHHCAYDLIPEVPEAVVAVTLFLAGGFFLGWACVTQALGRCRETEPYLAPLVGGLLRLSLWGYVASLAMLSLEMVLA
jgi:hypothetical protein